MAARTASPHPAPAAASSAPTGAPSLIRAQYAQLLVECIDRLPTAAAVRARVEPAVFTRVAGTYRLSFIDGADHQRLLNALGEALSYEELVSVLREQGRIFRESPTMGKMFEAVRRITGMGVHTAMRLIPKAREWTVQGCGTLTYAHVDDTTAHFRLVGYPAQLMNAVNDALFEATYLSVLDAVATDARVERRDVDVDAGAATDVITWKA